MSLISKRWNVAQKLPDTYFDQFPHLPRIVVQILHNRGITQPDRIGSFLVREAPGETDPLLLKGMPETVARIQTAIQNDEAIAVYGDFDADGVTATALMTQALTTLGARVRAYIPDRVDEGYGLNNDALKELATNGIRLVITVDCGIRAVDEVNYGQGDLGIDVIVTDHHTLGPQLPPALAIVNPKQPDCTYPFKQLAGVGLAYKVAQALIDAIPGNSLSEEELIDLVALGTVADLASLVDENRALVARGMKQISAGCRPGLRELMARAGVDSARVSAESIGFALGPRLNAAGRLDSAQPAYELLITNDPGRASELAQQLDSQNYKRRELTQSTVEVARQFIQADGVSSLLYLIADPAFNPGIVGLVSGRLCEEFYRPTLVARRGETVTKGSGRSIPEFHITQALDKCADLLVRHGGHSAAAGFTVKNENILALHTRLLEIAHQELADIELVPLLEVDAELNLRAIDRRRVEEALTVRAFGHKVDENDPGLKIVDGLEQLRPYGTDNPVPVFVTPGLEVKSKQLVGSDGRHLKLELYDGKQTWEAIAFGWANRNDSLKDRVDVAYELKINEWNGRQQLQLNIKDVKPSQA